MKTLHRTLALGALMTLALAWPVGNTWAITCGPLPGLPTCASLCDDDHDPLTPPTLASATNARIEILYLGSSIVPTWLDPALTTTAGDCSACAMVTNVDYRLTAITWATARTWLPEHFRAYDVIVTDGVSSLAFGVVAPLTTADPWLPVYRSALRVVATGLHVSGHQSTMSAMREFAQNSIAWLARDECCSALSGQGLRPGILIVDDRGLSPFAYTPWRGLARSYFGGTDAASGCPTSANLALDDIDIVPDGLGNCHETLNRTSDTDAPLCVKVACSYDNAEETTHAIWKKDLVATTPGETCGYEQHGFISVMSVVNSNASGCSYVAPCEVSPGVQFSGVEVTLVRDLGCCPGVEPSPPDLLGGQCAYPLP